jgi:hypothetical protein
VSEHQIYWPFAFQLNISTVLCLSYLNANEFLFAAATFKGYIFLYDLHKTSETLLHIIKIWSAKFKFPPVSILTVWNNFYELYPLATDPCNVCRDSLYYCSTRNRRVQILWTWVWGRLHMSYCVQTYNVLYSVWNRYFQGKVRTNRCVESNIRSTVILTASLHGYNRRFAANNGRGSIRR